MQKNLTNRMKTGVFLMMALAVASTANAQSWQWGMRGGGSSDGFNVSPHEAVTDIATDKNGNTYIIGIVEASGAPTVGSTSNYVTTYGGKDIIVSSFKCDGSYRWSKVIGGAFADRPTAIGTDTLGHVYVAMEVIPSSVPAYVVHYSSDSTQPLNSQKYLTLIQYDTSGNFKWLRQPTADTATSLTEVSNSYDIKVEKNGDVYWFTNLQPGLVSGGGGWAVSSQQCYILKYNAQGTMTDHIPLQMQTLGSFPYILRFNRMASGKFIIAATQDLIQASPMTIAGTAVTHTMFLAAFNAQGIYLWKKENTLNDLSTRMFSRPQIDAQGNIYYSGSCVKNDIFNGYTFTNPLVGGAFSVRTHPFIGKADSNGNHIWIKEASGRAADVSNSLVLKGNNEIWMSGTANSAWWDTVHYIQSPPNSGYPVYVARFNSAGTILGLDSLKGASGGLNYATCNAVDKNGNLIVGGEFNVSLNVKSGSTLTSAGGASDFFVAKFGYPCNCSGAPTSGFTSSVTGKTARFTYSGTTTNIDSVVWTFGDGQQQTVKSGFTSPVSHTYSTGGTYNACANVYGGCGTASDCKSVTVTGSGAVCALSALGNIKVYPNPANQFLNIEGAQGATAVLVNSVGQLAMQFSVHSDKEVIDISALPSGMYILQLTDAKGNRGAMSIVKQ